MEARNRFQGMNSASLCRLAGRYDNPIPTRFLAPIDCLKIPALAGLYDNPIPTRFLAPIDCINIPALSSKLQRFLNLKKGSMAGGIIYSTLLSMKTIFPWRRDIHCCTLGIYGIYVLYYFCVLLSQKTDTALLFYCVPGWDCLEWRQIGLHWWFFS
jgi:hypothetical protein